MTINLIAAVGLDGQIGLEGGIPWHSPEDLAWFKRMTYGGVVLFGKKTFESLPKLHGRTVVSFTRQDGIENYVEWLKHAYRGRTIWLAGGGATYRDFAPFVDGLKLISFINYSGPADTFFPFDAYGISR